MMNLNDDLDRLADLRLRLRHTRASDPALGCAIIALLLPGTIAGASAAGWLERSDGAVGGGLDITGSVEDALRFLGQLGFGPGWTIVREEPDDEPRRVGDARYGIRLRHRFFHCSGRGQTPATALVDVAIHAMARGATSYVEEDLPLLEPGEGSAQDDVKEPPKPPAVDGSDASPEMVLSDDPVERTRQIIGQCWPNLGMINDLCLLAVIEITGRLCVKSRNGRFGTMDGYELDSGILRVIDRETQASTRFDTLEDLLAAGWVID